MAKAWTKVEWNEELLRIARDAANALISKKNTAGRSQRQIEAMQKEYAHRAKKLLDEKYPFDKLTDKDKNTVASLKGDDASRLLLTGGTEAFRNSYDPLLKKRMDDFSKLGPLVLGIADEGRDWYNMGADDLFAKGEELGYDMSSKEGKMDFLSDIGDVQQAHDRGKILDEFNKENSVLSDMFYPTMMEEARKQITTGRGEKSDIYKAGVLDAAANGLIAAAPLAGELSVFSKSPFIGGTAGAILQGVLEGGRQYGKTVIDPELEADLTPMLTATTLGATRPGMIGTAAALSQQFPGRAMSRFARGVSSATRRGNPTYMEREDFETGLNLLGQLKRSKPEVIDKRLELLRKQGLTDEKVKEFLKNYGRATKLSDISKGRLAAKARQQLDALYGENKATSMVDNGFTTQSVLRSYDDLSNSKVYRDMYNFYDQLMPERELLDGTVREGDVLAKLEQAFPSKMAEAYGNDNWYRAGLGAGKILGNIGGSIEPVIKLNPLVPLAGGSYTLTGSDDYKETKWYKSLSKKQQEAFDDAYEKSKRASE